ncbi:hypothetical protein VIBNIAM115_520002 [Vibrio nigripulchritudo AM115]|nr:hypothetical protein VIBNIAM115_520002 [Vibrio nigripulchritudo AM115]
MNTLFTNNVSWLGDPLGSYMQLHIACHVYFTLSFTFSPV